MINITENGTKKDYHIHSCYSDGDLEPEQIVDRWMADGYRVISITDHDGVEGSKLADRYVRENGLDVTFIPGIEFDSSCELASEIHILGYGFDYENSPLRDALSKVLLWRAKRNDEILSVVNSLGYDVSIDELLKVNGGHYTGKPTFARVLVDKGYFGDVSEVFEKLLDSDERLCSLTKNTLSAKEVIDVIHDAGGIAIMAHPMEYRSKEESLESFMPRLVKLMAKLVEYGIDGIECDHPSATPAEAGWLRECARRNNLVMTCGSDFHSDFIKREY